jgi:mono/diheme cytochrome c family protein
MRKSFCSTKSAAAAAVLALAVAACGGSEQKASDTTATMPPAAAAPPEAVTPTPGGPPSGATAAMVAEGDSIFHGQAYGGLCFTCHGMDAKGGPLAPSLADTAWLTGDGSYAFIQKRVTEGMPRPTAPYVSPMLPMGGAKLTPGQIKSVAAYVYTISHPGS